MCLISAVWLNRETFLPSKLLQTAVNQSSHALMVVG